MLENIVKVKAILSWNLDPTPYGSTYSPTWGNVLIRNIQIRPEDGANAQCRIEIINEVHVDDIVQSGVDQGLAIKIDASNNTVVGTHDRPLGGVIACWGNINIPNAAHYRFRYSARAILRQNGQFFSKVVQLVDIYVIYCHVFLHLGV